MKSLLSLTVICVFSQFAFATEIYVMDTIEFKTVRHNAGKRKYVEGLTKILKKMRLKQESFDAMNSDQHEIYELIQTKRWAAIVGEIEKQCSKNAKAQKANCEALADLREDIFDYIKENPENYGDPADATDIIR